MAACHRRVAARIARCAAASVSLTALAAPLLAQQPQDAPTTPATPDATSAVPLTLPSAAAAPAGPDEGTSDPNLRLRDERPTPLGGGLSQPGGFSRDSDLLLPDSGSELSSYDSSRDQLDAQTVRGRKRPAYDAVGVPAGSFRLYPELSAGLGYDSNVFAQRNGVSDGYATVRGSARIKSDWGRHALSADGYVNERAYFTYPSESGVTYNVHASGRYDIGDRDSITAQAEHSHEFLDRGAVGETLLTRRPIRYNLTGGDIAGTKHLGRFVVTLDGLVQREDYEDAERPDGSLLPQQFRDFTRYAARLDVGYDTGAGRTFFVSATRDWRRYDERVVIDRDEDGYELLAGVRSEITPLIRGKIALGYVEANFKDPTIKSRGGLAADIQLDYLVTDLTTVTLEARRFFQNVSSTTAPAALTTNVQLRVDHELLRNLILSLSGSYQNANYVAVDGGARRIGGQLGAIWLINRSLRLSGDAGYRKRTGRGDQTGRNYDETFASTAVTFAL